MLWTRSRKSAENLKKRGVLSAQQMEVGVPQGANLANEYLLLFDAQNTHDKAQNEDR